ncbi:MAG TPA: hypothetical protein VK465_11085, partial [Fibrobacteria bacterium]|nr:hypothetical protein [Fibrobacteria bacterium]
PSWPSSTLAGPAGGHSFCVVVMDGDVRMQSLSPLKADLRGANLGKAAFEVLQVSPPSNRPSELPEVKVRILSADVVCKGAVTLLPDVPVPGTYCDNDGGACRPNELLIEESWNTLDSTKWVFDGDGLVANGFFQAREDARSAVADWIMPCPVRLESNSDVRFSNRLRLELAQQHDFAEAGALFFVQAGPLGSSENYVFLNVGFSMAPSKVFVELFGADDGTQFDQFMETSLAHQPSLDFDLDLSIDRGSYRVGVNGVAIDTVRLSKPIEKLSLFEVGVQQLGEGLRGLVDRTNITRTCKAECKYDPCKPCQCCKQKSCGSLTCKTKSDKTCCPHASKQNCPQICKTKSDKTCCYCATKPGKDCKTNPCGCHQAPKDDKYCKGVKVSSGEATLAAAQVWGAAPPNPCSKNALILMARAKVAEVAEPMEGLRILADMPLATNCGE